MGLLDGVNNLQGLQGFQSGGGTGGSAFGDLQNAAKKGLGNVGEKLGDLGDMASGTVKGGVRSVRSMLGEDANDLEAAERREQIQQQSMVEEFNEVLNLSWIQKIILFLMTFAAGAIMICLSVAFLPLIVIKPAKFALSFTFGNVLAIVSTWFLVGPRAQLRAMFDPVRAWAAALYIGSLLLTIVAVFFPSRLRYIFVLLAVCTEIFALVWYALSFIPYGRQVISRIISSTMGGSISI
mmetsp:Transcript_4673/g.14122  ORF Transcript_4673/g.14122 Transcript_4673/m.14122 type:complete len:238 (-) Transcript_4673:188-901(-)|eukprot:CAMPEP_0198726854 /NCGR_PEP_ID=MMETSP1475-20131203/3775_1 /TAXON_ID= ORGANISM="Unidentified sp., Strain CCMP1999" /NCGR_SAMPLE_ID=MMETSP1475 /ASSEMBLY_ACC=CAM_ASM_001111 /LENGTH=237 /DNA_ID=CAMNT_0044488827 /DNA_START=276 /DNA_END=989 /DNA_ORIENTATION=+